MPIKIRYKDITSYKSDVIINSLGTKGNVYGKICHSIITKANSQELKEYIDKQNNPIGTILVTDSGELKCKQIIHLVTPFKSKDDEKNSLLIKCIKDCFNKALELGHKSLAIPFIGTGTNGYSEVDVFNAIGDASEDILKEEESLNKDILTISVIGYLKRRNPYKERRVIEEYDRNFICPSNNSYESEIPSNPLIEDYMNYAEEILFNKEDLLIPSREWIKPYDYYDDFVFQKNINELQISKQGFDRRLKHRLRNQDVIKKINIIRLSYLAKMNKTQVLQWLHLAGYTLSPLSKIDMFYWKYINGYYDECDSFPIFIQLVYSETGIDINFGEKEKE